jgi:putative ABC transport system permease protein
MAVGLVLSLVVAHVLSKLVHGLPQVDLVVFGTQSALLAAVAFAACYIPARRAAGADAMAAIRHE